MFGVCVCGENENTNAVRTKEQSGNTFWCLPVKHHNKKIPQHCHHHSHTPHYTRNHSAKTTALSFNVKIVLFLIKAYRSTISATLRDVIQQKYSPSFAFFWHLFLLFKKRVVFTYSQIACESFFDDIKNISLSDRSVGMVKSICNGLQIDGCACAFVLFFSSSKQEAADESAWQLEQHLKGAATL